MFTIKKRIQDLFKDKAAAPTAAQHPVPLAGLLHFHARRGAVDEGFIVAISALSGDAFQFLSHERVGAGETLTVKIVSGAQSIELTARVRCVDDGPRRFVGDARFLDVTERERTVIDNLVRRFGRSVA